MKAKDLQREISTSTGKLILNVSEIAEILRSNRAYAKKVMDGVEYLERGKSKYYLVSDVAKQVAKEFRL